MIEFVSIGDTLYYVPVSEVRRIMLGTKLATVVLKGARFDAQICVTREVGEAIVNQMTSWGKL